MHIPRPPLLTHAMASLCPQKQHPGRPPHIRPRGECIRSPGDLGEKKPPAEVDHRSSDPAIASSVSFTTGAPTTRSRHDARLHNQSELGWIRRWPASRSARQERHQSPGHEDHAEHAPECQFQLGRVRGHLSRSDSVERVRIARGDAESAERGGLGRCSGKRTGWFGSPSPWSRASLCSAAASAAPREPPLAGCN